MTFGRRISGLVVNGRELRAPVFNENEVRAAAGLTMVMGAIAFSFAVFSKVYWPLQATTVFFFIDFVIRVTVGLEYSPTGVVARVLAGRQRPHWVSAKPKRFAWSIGLVMSFAMVLITNTGIRGALPAAICLTCLTLMWMESVLSLCVGCELYAFLMRRGWIERDEEIELCASGVCELPARPAAIEAGAGAANEEPLHASGQSRVRAKRLSQGGDEIAVDDVEEDVRSARLAVEEPFELPLRQDQQ